MKKDLEIALSNEMKHINKVASKLGIAESEMEITVNIRQN